MLRSVLRRNYQSEEDLDEFWSWVERGHEGFLQEPAAVRLGAVGFDQAPNWQGTEGGGEPFTTLIMKLTLCEVSAISHL